MKRQLTRSGLDLSISQILSLVKIYTPVCLFIFFVWLLTENTSISVYELVADPNAVANTPPYTGIVSTLGILFLCGAVSICFFSAYLVKIANKSDKKWRLFLQASGYFVLLLLVDDLFQIHENFSTLLFGAEANISLFNRKLQNLLETIVFGFYGSLLVFYIFYFRKLIYRTDFLSLILTFCFFGMSATIDILFENIKGEMILEEGFKLLGIISLFTYYTRVCYQKSNDYLNLK